MEKEITFTLEEVVAEFDRWLAKCKEVYPGKISVELETLLRNVFLKFIKGAAHEHCSAVFGTGMLRVFFECIDKGLIDPFLDQLETEEEKMNNFIADFYMFQEALGSVEIEELCEDIFTREECPEKMKFSTGEGKGEKKVTFHFSEIPEYDEDGNVVFSSRNLKYSGCAYEEITEIKRITTSY